MLLQTLSVLICSGVFACSDCFSKCSNTNKNECLLDCGCPLFTSSQVYSGSFHGSTGKLYVPDLTPEMSIWAQQSLSCDLPCSSKCSSSYLDAKLESCIQACGCGSLLSKTSLNKNDSIQAKCNSICQGSSSGCLTDCVGHAENKPGSFYLWFSIPASVFVFVLAWLSIKSKKEDDYIQI